LDLWFFSVTGCAAYHHPVITVTGAKLAETSDEALALRFGLDLHNPNNEALTLVEFTYELSIDGRNVYHGSRAGETVLAIHGDKHVEIPGVVRFDRAGWHKGAIPAAATFALDGRLTYITPGKIVQILFDTGVRKPKAPFAGTGQVELRPDQRSEIRGQRSEIRDQRLDVRLEK